MMSQRQKTSLAAMIRFPLLVSVMGQKAKLPVQRHINRHLFTMGHQTRGLKIRPSIHRVFRLSAVLIRLPKLRMWTLPYLSIVRLLRVLIRVSIPLRRKKLFTMLITLLPAVMSHSSLYRQALRVPCDRSFRTLAAVATCLLLVEQLLA